MGALPPIRRVFKEDLGPDVPNWITRLLSPLNLVLDNLYRTLNKNVTFTENIRSQIREFTIVAGANPEDNTYLFPNGVGAKPTGLLVVAVFAIDGTPVTTGAVTASWSWLSTTNAIQISGITGLTNGVGYLIRVLVI